MKGERQECGKKRENATTSRQFGKQKSVHKTLKHNT